MIDIQAVRDELLADLEETLESQGYLPMHDFAWTLRGYELGLTPQEIQSISAEVYELLIAKTPSRLMWNVWPKDLDGAWDADAGTEPDFDLDPDRPKGIPLLMLVPRRT
ncbi:hypothetical protein [Nocardioides plantarum]|uniref:Uncharacterized protein n=1 Tax=Nocardioides plantarum TaxID=29299 RepID=A0ABV5K9D0_9ACTN|nr:hypothetical protein [Nocardioides plantarum]